MRIKDIPELAQDRPLFQLAADDTIQAAARKMAERNVGAMVILDGAGRISGLFSERDLLREVAKGAEVASKTVGEAMTTGVVTVTMEDYLDVAMEKMSAGRFRHLPVVNGEGRCVGMLSQRDFAALSMGEALARARTVAMAKVARSYQPFVIMAAVALLIVIMVGAL